MAQQGDSKEIAAGQLFCTEADGKMAEIVRGALTL